MKIPEVVGKRIYEARRGAEISQAELGQRLGEYLGKAWFPQAVSEAEKGRRNFTAEELFALAIVLDKPVAWFFLPPAGEDFDLARTVPLGEVAGGPLLGVPNHNAAAALVQEALAIVNDLDTLRAQLHQRAGGVIRVANMMVRPEEEEEED
jgi:transcriptional regulator with XRE-family HTH domain